MAQSNIAELARCTNARFCCLPKNNSVDCGKTLL
jgi:hypothetical protein